MPAPGAIFARKRRGLGIKRRGNHAVINAHLEPKGENAGQQIVRYNETNKPAVGDITLDKRLIKNYLEKKEARNKLESKIGTLLKKKAKTERFAKFKKELYHKLKLQESTIENEHNIREKLIIGRRNRERRYRQDKAIVEKLDSLLGKDAKEKFTTIINKLRNEKYKPDVIGSRGIVHDLYIDYIKKHGEITKEGAKNILESFKHGWGKL